MTHWFKDSHPSRLRTGVILLGLTGLALSLIRIGSPATASPAPSPETSASPEAHAYSMPNQGWAPLEVNFSAFGSRAAVGQISRYEWDLDGDGDFETDASAAGGYAKYTFVRPGSHVVTLRVTDSGGGSATDQIEVTVRHPASSGVDYWMIFDDSQVRRVDLIVPRESWALMWDDPSAKRKVRADVVVFGERLKDVGLSMKGNASLDASGDKKSWKVDTDFYVEGQEFRNLKQLLFHNNFMDASMLREKLAYDMARFAGVPASHVTFVELWIDVEDDDRPASYWGVYTMVERLDRKYVANRFGQANDGGNLYKADAWFEQGAADLAYYGEDIEDYPKPRGEVAYGLQTNREDPDYSDIIHLAYVIDGVEYPDPEAFAEALEGVLNVDGYLRYIAVIFTNLNLDTYPYTGNNFFLYDNPGTGKFEFLPWDMNNSWGHFAGGFDFPLFGEEGGIGPLEYAPLFTKVFQVERYRRDYLAYLDLLTRSWFNADQLGDLASRYHALLSPYVRQGDGDRMYFGSTALFTVEDFDRDWLDLVALTAARSKFIQSRLPEALLEIETGVPGWGP